MFAFRSGGHGSDARRGALGKKERLSRRRSVAHPRADDPDRVRNLMVSGNDIEIGVLLDRAGHRRFYVPELRIDHKIPRARLGTRYMTRLITGVVRSQATLDDAYGAPRSGLRRLLDVAQVAGALLAAPVLAVRREDGLRDAWFVLVSRIASARGPYAEIRRTMRAASEPTTQRSDKSCAS